MLVESVDKRMSSLHNELEPSEIQQLENNWLRPLESEVGELCAGLKGELSRVTAAGQERRDFEDTFNQAKEKLREITSENLEPIKEQPLTAFGAEKIHSHFKVSFYYF